MGNKKSDVCSMDAWWSVRSLDFVLLYTLHQQKPSKNALNNDAVVNELLIVEYHKI